jgi:hypothetical protein
VSLAALLDEVQSLETALGGESPPDPERFVRLDGQVRAQAEGLSKAELQTLVFAMERLGEVAREQRQDTKTELAKLGGGRRAVRGYGCLRSSSQGQRFSKKA